MTRVCPYCGNTDAGRGFSAPEPLCRGLPATLGIAVPLIQQCLKCQATLSPAAFESGSALFARAVSARQPAPA